MLSNIKNGAGGGIFNTSTTTKVIDRQHGTIYLLGDRFGNGKGTFGIGSSDDSYYSYGGYGWYGGSVGSSLNVGYGCGGTGYVMGHPTDANGDSTSTYPDGYFNNDSELIERLTNAITNGTTATSSYGASANIAANRILLRITALPTETESPTKYYAGVNT